MAEKRRRRLRSGAVVLGGMGALAAALTACGSEPDKRCVDRNSYNALKGYRILGDAACAPGARQTPSGSDATRTPGAVPHTPSKKALPGKAGKKGLAGKKDFPAALPSSRPSAGSSASRDPQWYYDPTVDGQWADYGTFNKEAAVERDGFGSGSGSSGG
ncbi:hypothetical protein [Streptomyces sp. NPDC003077]|uniref:hypothetical protein n=1 Tax=Streptomyces sp. NPDC003077 TaxID=3154443 RepID=UPI0033B5CE8B